MDYTSDVLRGHPLQYLVLDAKQRPCNGHFAFSEMKRKFGKEWLVQAAYDPHDVSMPWPREAPAARRVPRQRKRAPASEPRVLATEASSRSRRLHESDQATKLLPAAQHEMAELEGITEALRRQRKDLDEMAESTSTRTNETAALLEKIEELRARAEKSQRAFEAQQTEKK